MTSTEKVHVLLIEDNMDMAELIQAYLASIHRFSFSIMHVETLAEGVQQLKNKKYEQNSCHVVLLDLNLPDSDGFATFETVMRQTRHIPIILMTNLDDEELAIRAVRQGAQDYLVKSEMDAGMLYRAIRYAIERNRVEEALRESQERYTLAIQGANDGLWDWDLRTNKVYFSPRWKNMLGYSDTEIGDQPSEWLNRIHPDDIDYVRVTLSAHIKGTSAHFESEHRIERKDKTYMWVLTRGFAVRNGGNKAYRMAGSQTDITLRKRTEEQLIHDAFHDALTGLPNRALFIDRLGRALEHVKRHQGYRFAIFFLDLDRFKVINDSLGHAFGDQVLVTVAQKLSNCLRPSDSIARMGGDEFVILLEELSQPSDIEIISSRIQNALQTSLEINGQKIAVSASIGIVLSDMEYHTAEDILRDADIAMYHAKMLGKATHAIFSPSMRKRAIIRMELENELRQVLECEERRKRELSVVFQPILSIQDNHITGFEALLRWNHPERGPIRPIEFIPVAEETDLIHFLGLWVLREACSQLRMWQDHVPPDLTHPLLSVNVNISGKQFSHPDLVENIKKILQETNVDPSCLSLEITESWLMEGKEPYQDTLDKIRRLGIKLQVDDFGRGYSSFRYLQSLPVTTLKIDQLFVQRLGVDSNNSEIVRSIVGLARSLGMSVVAEGVETEIQLRKLKELGCPLIQGFYISKPLNGMKAEQLLLKNWSTLPV